MTNEDDLAREVQELNKRISELEKMLSQVINPLKQARETTSNYFRIIRLLLDNGGLTPEVILPEVRDPIAQEIVRVLLERNEQNISQITEHVRNKRGTSSRRIIREKLFELGEKKIVKKQQKGSLYVYSLTEKVMEKWSQLLGFKL